MRGSLEPTRALPLNLDLTAARPPAAGYLNGSADTCTGDSGGPLVDTRGGASPGAHRLVGVTSWGWGGGCGRPGFPGVYVRLDTYAGFIQQRGYCGCVVAPPTPAIDGAGCSAAVLQAERQAGLAAWEASGGGGPTAACYVIAPERCSYAAASKLYTGAALAPCDSSTNLTAPTAGQLAAPPDTEMPGSEPGGVLAAGEAG